MNIKKRSYKALILLNLIIYINSQNKYNYSKNYDIKHFKDNNLYDGNNKDSFIENNVSAIVNNIGRLIAANEEASIFVSNNFFKFKNNKLKESDMIVFNTLKPLSFYDTFLSPDLFQKDIKIKLDKDKFISSGINGCLLELMYKNDKNEISKIDLINYLSDKNKDIKSLKKYCYYIKYFTSSVSTIILPSQFFMKKETIKMKNSLNQEDKDFIKYFLKVMFLQKEFKDLQYLIEHYVYYNYINNKPILEKIKIFIEKDKYKAALINYLDKDDINSILNFSTLDYEKNFEKTKKY